MPGQPSVPLGVYDHPPDPEFPYIHGIRVGGSFAAKSAATATKAVNDVTRLLPSWGDLIPGL